MKLRNKKTGEIIKSGDMYNIMSYDEYQDRIKKEYSYNSLAELNEEWEDYEEPKEQYYIKENGVIGTCGAIEDDIPDEMLSEMKEIGNYFETKEEAEKAVEKLKAWKRLKDKGLKFHLGKYENKYVAIEANWGVLNGGFSDVFILFGGEE